MHLFLVMLLLLMHSSVRAQSTTDKDPRWLQVGIIKGSDTSALKKSKQLLQDWFGEVKYSDIPTASY
jgi:hypothetical protein